MYIKVLIYILFNNIKRLFWNRWKKWRNTYLCRKTIIEWCLKEHLIKPALLAFKLRKVLFSTTPLLQMGFESRPWKIDKKL